MKKFSEHPLSKVVLIYHIHALNLSAQRIRLNHYLVLVALTQRTAETSFSRLYLYK
jgi:hypothetical protein